MEFPPPCMPAITQMQLVRVIIQHALDLVTDPFGNYVVQYILDLQLQDVVDSVTDSLLGHVGGLCMDKFSSNVIEKVTIEFLSPTVVRVDNICTLPPTHRHPSPSRDNSAYPCAQRKSVQNSSRTSLVMTCLASCRCGRSWSFSPCCSLSCLVVSLLSFLSRARMYSCMYVNIFVHVIFYNLCVCFSKGCMWVCRYFVYAHVNVIIFCVYQ